MPIDYAEFNKVVLKPGAVIGMVLIESRQYLARYTRFKVIVSNSISEIESQSVRVKPVIARLPFPYLETWQHATHVIGERLTKRCNYGLRDASYCALGPHAKRSTV